MPGTHHYFANGSGRDRYISIDNGGFRPGMRRVSSASVLQTQFKLTKPARLRLPGITAESRRFMAKRQTATANRLSTPKSISSGPTPRKHHNAKLAAQNTAKMLRSDSQKIMSLRRSQSQLVLRAPSQL